MGQNRSTADCLRCQWLSLLHTNIQSLGKPQLTPSLKKLTNYNVLRTRYIASPTNPAVGVSAYSHSARHAADGRDSHRPCPVVCPSVSTYSNDFTKVSDVS